MLGAYQLGYLLSGASRAIFAPAEFTRGKTSQPDARVPPGPSLLLFSLGDQLVAGRAGEHGACTGSRQGSRARAQGLSVRKHVTLQLGAYFLNILSAEVGQR